MKISLLTQSNRTRKYLVLALTCVAFSAMLVSTSLKAFDPDAPDYGHSYITRSIAGQGYNGWGKSVPEFTATLVASPVDTLRFSPEAIDQLVTGTRAPDFLQQSFGYFYDADVPAIGFDGLFIFGEPTVAAAHCDDEKIGQCSLRIFNFTANTAPASNASSWSPVQKMQDESAINMLFEGATLLLRENPSLSELEEKQAYAYGIAARVKVGRSLHTVQDFYAHSNWTNLFLYRDDFWERLGKDPQGNKSTVDGEEIDNLVQSKVYNKLTETCSPVLIPEATLTAVKDESITAGIWSAATSLFTESILLGLAQFGLAYNNIKQKNLDFDKSGGNWAFSGQAKTQADGQSASVGSVGITTGYFDILRTTVAGIHSAPDGTDPSAASKCDHGLGKIGNRVAGINKDTPFTQFSPFPQGESGPATTEGARRSVANPSQEHLQASFHAARATKQILQNVVDAASVKAGGNTALRDKMVELFMGIRPVVAIVVDTTGSMQDIMDGVKQTITEVAAQEANSSYPGVPPGSSLNKNKKFTLTTFTESATGVATVTLHRIGPKNNFGTIDEIAGRAEDVVRKLDTLPPAAGGGDCPEPTLKALLDTIKRTPRKSKIFVFTDASSKDSDTQGSDGVTRKESAEITRLVDKKKLEVTFSLSGSCSPISPAYHQIAQASGGQVMLVDHTSSDTSVALAGVAPGNRPFSTIHTERSALAAGISKGIVIPVESGASQLLISVTNDSSAIAVRNPAGELQTLTTFLGGSLLKVANPAPGNWSVGVSGWPTNPPGAPASAYSIKAQAIGAFDLGTLEYSNKDAAGRSGHEIHMPYGNNPPSTDVRIAAQLGTNAPTNPSTYAWQAIAEDGTVLGPLNLARKTPDQYEGTAAIGTISANATRPWRVRVSGTDSTGQPFARVLPTLQNATRVTANITQLPNHWVPGAEHLVKIRIDNYGAADGFSLPGSASLGQLVGITPNAEVPAGDYAIVTAKLSIPANTPANSAGLLKLSLNSRNAANGTVQTINIPYTVLQDTDGDGVPDIIEKGSNGIDDNFDGNADGIPDWKQANVISLPSDQRRAYLTASLSAGQFRLARTIPAESLAQLKYTIDLIDFKITGLTAGAATQMKLQLPGYMTASGYGKFGPVPGNTNAAWYDFNYDPATGLGAKVDKNIITLYLKDGAKGDDDLTANGEIVDIGGPVGVQIAGVGTASTGSTTTTTTTPSGTTTSTPTSTPSGATATTATGNPNGSGTNAPGANPFSGSSGGGGCTIGNPSNPNPDASLCLLLLASLGVLGGRRVLQRRTAAAR